MNEKLSNIFYSVLILFMSYVFINKALDVQAFQINIFKTGLFSGVMAKIISYIALALELFSIIFLIINKQNGLRFLFIILTIFTLYISVLRSLHRYEVCGCGGILNGLSYISHLLINLLLIFMSLLSLHLGRSTSNTRKNKS